MKLKVITIISLLLIVLIYSCQSDDAIEFKRYYSSGSVVYQNHCQNCHGAKGEGLLALIPPLNDSAYLKSHKEIMPCFVKNGVKGNLRISGRQFDDVMPAVSLTPIEIAQVLTYVTNSFGNKLGVVTDDEVGVDLSKCN